MPKHHITSHEGETPDAKSYRVGFWNLRVLIVPEGDDCYFAQCKEIDYAAEGSTIEEAKKNFEKGFVATIYHHLKFFGSLKNMIRPVSDELWQELLGEATSGDRQFTLTHTSLHTIIPQKAQALVPYGYKGIEYVEPAALVQ